MCVIIPSSRSHFQISTPKHTPSLSRGTTNTYTPSQVSDTMSCIFLEIIACANPPKRFLRICSFGSTRHWPKAAKQAKATTRSTPTTVSNKGTLPTISKTRKKGVANTLLPTSRRATVRCPRETRLVSVSISFLPRPRKRQWCEYLKSPCEGKI